MSEKIDVLIIGAGPAGVAAGIGAKREGAENVVVIERDWDLGGILQQCIHPGFGLRTFKEELTGPEYMHRFIQQAHEAGVEFRTNTMVFQIDAPSLPPFNSPLGRGDERVAGVLASPVQGEVAEGRRGRNIAQGEVSESRRSRSGVTVWTMNKERGIESLNPSAIVLTMGCRERPLGAIRIPGTRPAGIYTAGTAQRFVNMEGYMPGKRAVILGSGDIGLIMARRMIWEGATVEGVYEVMSWPGGLRRNIAQCLDDYGIPFHLRTTVTRIHGNDRLEGVTVAEVDDHMTPIAGTERYVECDTLLLAIGLIPENELSRMAGVEIHPVTGGPVVNDLLQTSNPAIFAAGNVVIVYDLVDNVSDEGLIAGANAAKFAAGKISPSARIPVKGGENVRLYSPQIVTGETDATIFMRVTHPIEEACRVFAVCDNGAELYSQRLRYARPGEMNEVRINAEKLRGAGKVSGITIDIQAVKK
ncbi:MAG: FAD-dependent oxidoreductase [Synergistaceae bacterium]|nr:FAD-dependent oxidoreductase [Synergistaceae bacterium]